jgi:hypothetical protein
MPRTREEERAYRREWRRKRAEAAAGATVVWLPAAKPSSEGEVQAGVKAEIAGLPAAASHPGITQAAYAMARILDTEEARPHHPAAARSLDSLLTRLHDLSKGTAAASYWPCATPVATTPIATKYQVQVASGGRESRLTGVSTPLSGALRFGGDVRLWLLGCCASVRR